MSTGSVSGQVLVDGVPSPEASFGATVWLYQPSTNRVVSAAILLSGAADYTLAAVPIGKWEAFFRPDPQSGFSTATYGAGSGTSVGTKLTVRRNQTTTGIDFQPVVAGFLRVRVKDDTGQVVPGAKIIVQNLDRALAGLPTETLANGEAYVANAPAVCKVCIIGPDGFATQWYPEAATFRSGARLVVKQQGANMTLNVTLRRAT